jgi:regulator of protease activity HflC (stomatin/prohibitin superfamily)
MILTLIGIGFIVAVGFAGIRTVRPTDRGLIERMGKYVRFAEPGMHWVTPLIERLYKVRITESMMKIDTQEIITEDNLNAKVDLVVYYKVKEEEESVKKSIYKVSNFVPQITILAQTTTRNVIGTMAFKDVNSKRNELNAKLLKVLKTETANWGVEIVRVELRDINPPAEVQETMNKVIQAENAKRAAVDFATATETQADGERRAAIKRAEGLGQGKLIVAEAEAKKIKLINESANKYFKGNAQKLKQIEMVETSLKDNSKIVIVEKGIKPQLLIGSIPTLTK